MDKTKMSDIDMTAEMSKLNPSERHFVKKLERMNTDRAKTMQVLRKRNKLFGALIGGTAFGIYMYTIFSVKQEKFLDFDVTPEKK